MNIEEFVNDYLQEHRHDVLLNPYNGLIDFAKAIQDEFEKEDHQTDVEEWRPVVGYTNYEVSNTGKVLSRKQLKDGVLLQQRTTWSGYKFVTLHDDNYTAHTCFVHRLVAEAFIPNPENKKTVNHKNENKSDNRVSNLEWATYTEQCSHGSMRGIITNSSLQTATDGEKKKFIRMRKYLRERGYIIDNDNLIAYWTDDTNRAVRMEKEPVIFQYRKYCGESVPDYIARSVCRKEVERIDENGNVKKYNSMTEAAKDNGVSISAIKRVLIGTNKSGKCNGCTFRYSKELPKEGEQ